MSLFWTDVRLSCRVVLPLVLLLSFGQPRVKGVVLDAVSFQLPAPPALAGNLASNNLLLDAELIHTGQIGAPHSYVALGDNMFAVTDMGLVVNVAPCRPAVIANLRPRGCRTLQECGHLVSLRLSQEKLLIVLDAYRGVFEVHPLTGNVRQVYDSNTSVNGRPSVYLSDQVFMKDGTIILSDASPTFNYDNEFWIRYEGRPDGRLIGFNPTNGQAKEILAGIAYPTGLEVTDDGMALFISEAGRARILRIDLRKDKFFQRTFFISNLPGMPEHIRKSGRGTYWVGLSYPRYQGDVSIMDQYCSKPISRNFLAGRRTMEQLKLMYTKRGLAVEVDETGRILRSLHDPTGLKVGEVLEVTEYSAVLYVGTRTQRSTVRIVGSPNLLTVDSLVQVLRGRCTVSEDRVMEAKASVEQQLKAKQTVGQTMSNPFLSANGFSNERAPNLQNGSPPLSRYNVDIGQGLYDLHKKLANASPQAHRPPKTPSQFSQGHQNYHSYAPPFQQPGNPFVSTNDNFPGRQNAHGHNQFNQQRSSGPAIAFDDPFLLLNAPRGNIPLQKANRLPQSPTMQETTGSSNQPRVVHRLHDGQLISHVILGKKAEAALAGNVPTLQQEGFPQPNPLQPQNDTSAPNHAQKIVPSSSQNLQQQQQQQQPQRIAISHKTPSADMSTLGGFMGFIDVATVRPGATVVTGDQTSKQDPNTAISMPDHKLPGHLEPLHSINPSSPHQVEQSVSGVESFPNLEQFTGSVANSQGQSKRGQTSINGPQSINSQASSQHFTNSFVGNVQKRPADSALDTFNKEAVMIQNVQMFHPTDSPSPLLQSQNYAGPKVGSTFQQKASLLKEGLQQLQKMVQENKPNQTYFSAPPSQPQAQITPKQADFRQNLHRQNTGFFDMSEAGLTTALRTQNGQVPPSQSLNEQGRASITGAALVKSVSRMNDRNNADVSKQPVISFSGAATIHPNQPPNNVFDKSFQNNNRAASDKGQETVQSATNFGVLTNQSDSQSLSTQLEGSRTLVSDTEPRILHPLPASTSSSIPVPTDTVPNSGVAPMGYIQIYQAPGKYLLIPLTQSSLLQALSGLSISQVQSTQIAKSYSQILQPSTGTHDQGTLTQTPQEPGPLPTLTLLQPQRQNEQIQQNLPRENQTQTQQQIQPLQQQGQIQHLQNQPLLQQSKSWSQQTVQTNPESQRQNTQTFMTPAPQNDLHSSRVSGERNTNSNHQREPFSTMLPNNTVTTKPSWSTHNSDQQHLLSTQQFTQQFSQPTHQFTQSKQFAQPTQQLTQPAQQFTQPAHQFAQSGQQFIQPTQQFAQPGQQFTQPTHQFAQSGQQFTQSRQQFTQPTQQFAEPGQKFTQPTHQFAQFRQQFTQPTQQFAEPGQKFTQPTHQFAQSGQQFTQPTQQFAEPGQKFTQPTHQFAQSGQQFTQPIQQFAQPSQQFTQAAAKLVQPTQQFTLSNQQFTPPAQHFNPPNQKYTEPSQQFTQQGVREPYQHFMSNPTQQFNIQSTPHSQQRAQQYSQHPTQQPFQQFNNYSAPLSTILPTQPPTQQFIQPNSQQSTQQHSEQQNELVNEQSPHLFTQQRRQQSTQSDQQLRREQSSHFTQSSPQWFNPRMTDQQSTQQTSQQFNDQSNKYSTHQSIPQSPQQSSRYSTQQSFQESPQLSNDQSLQQFTQASQVFSQQSVQQFSDRSTQHFTLQPTQQSSKQVNTQSSQQTILPTIEQVQLLTQQPTPQSPQQVNGQFSQDFTQQPTQQSPQKVNDQSTQDFTQQPTQQSSQQINDQSTHDFTQQSNQKSPQQVNDQSTQDFTQQSTQQLPQHITDQSTQQSIKNSPQQSNDQGTRHHLQQLRLQASQKSAQQLPQHSKQESSDQLTQFTQQPTQHSSIQMTSQSVQQSTQQPEQEFNTKTTSQFTQQSSIQQSSQTFMQPATHDFKEQPKQQLIQQSKQRLNQPSVQQYTQPFIPNPTVQPIQHTSQTFITSSVQKLTDSPQHLTQGEVKKPTAQLTEETNQPSDTVLQQV